MGLYLIAQSADKVLSVWAKKGVMSRKESQGRIMIFGGGSDCEVPGTCDNPNEPRYVDGGDDEKRGCIVFSQACLGNRFNSIYDANE